MKFLYLLPLLVAVALCAPQKYDQRQEGEVNVRADLSNFVILALIPKIDTGAGAALLNALSKSLPARRDISKDIDRSGIQEENIPNSDPDEAGPRTTDAFIKPKAPYQVDINKTKFNIAKLYPDNLAAASRSSGNVESTSSTRKLSQSESPLPDVVPVKNNKYITPPNRNGKIVEVINADIAIPETIDGKQGIQPENFNRKKESLESGLELLGGAMENCAPDQYRDGSGICRLIP